MRTIQINWVNVANKLRKPEFKMNGRIARSAITIPFRFVNIEHLNIHNLVVGTETVKIPSFGYGYKAEAKLTKWLRNKLEGMQADYLNSKEVLSYKKYHSYSRSAIKHTPVNNNLELLNNFKKYCIGIHYKH